MNRMLLVCSPRRVRTHWRQFHRATGHAEVVAPEHLAGFGGHGDWLAICDGVEGLVPGGPHEPRWPDIAIEVLSAEREEMLD